MKIVLLGKNGQLGWEFQRILPILGEVISLDRKELDLCDLGAIQKNLSEWKPNLIINASAYTDVDGAEKETDLAMKINALAPGIIAEMSRKLQAVFIHYSTDYVFDGGKNALYIETDQTNPLNMYGKSKLMGEENIRQAGEAYLILRTSWVYSLRGNSFVNKVLKWSRQNKTLKVVSDQVSGPTWARTLAEITSFVLAQNKKDIFENIRERRGTYHLAGSGFASRYEWAKQILANDPEPSEQIVQAIEPALSEDFPTPATRPLFSALNCSHFEETFGMQLPSWNSTLQLAMTR
jgi:dTDP-4-dehydrorhamnose reductase